MNEGTLDLELNGRPLDRVEATVDVPCCLHMCIRAVSCPTTRAAGVWRMGGEESAGGRGWGCTHWLSAPVTALKGLPTGILLT